MLLALGIVAVGVSAQAAQARVSEPAIPSEIAVPAGNELFLVGHARGVQIYECTSTPTGFSWQFVAPRANLYDDRGRLIITHFAGPTWQARDGSQVVGRLEDGVTVKRGAIPWLLLSRASSAPGPSGNQLEHTTFIQRISTTGGLAPALALCNDKTVGVKRGRPYTADYLFYKAD